MVNNSFSERQNEALLESIEHWLDNYNKVAELYEAFDSGMICVDVLKANIDLLPIYSDSCKCCELYYDNPFTDKICSGCPISSHTKLSGCEGTPWSNVVKYVQVIKYDMSLTSRSITRKDVGELLEAVIIEYHWLVSLWLGDLPEPAWEVESDDYS